MRASLRPTRPWKSVRLLAFAPLLAIVALMCWAVASPIGSSPDDDFHLASIWCAGGEKAGECLQGPTDAQRAIPTSLVGANCYAHEPEVSAKCQVFDSSAGYVVTSRGNFTGLYPPVFYSTMNLLASANIEASAVLMRLLNILLLVGITTALCTLLPTSRRVPLLWGQVITTVPLGIFLLASNNPSAWAIISAGTLWIALLGYFETSGWKRTILGGFAVLSTILGAGSRADAAVYAVVAVLAVLILTAAPSRRWVVSALLPVGIVVIAVGSYFSATQSSSAMSGLTQEGDGLAGVSWQTLLVDNLLEVPSLWIGVFGSWNLGWLDTHLPAVIWVGNFVVFAAVIFAGLKAQSIRKVIATGMVLGAMWIVPTYILVQSKIMVGNVVQPRYILPLIIMFAGIALLPVGASRLSFSWTQIAVLIAILSFSNSLALHLNISRYVTPGASILWWEIPLPPIFVWGLGSLAFAALLATMAWTTLRPVPDNVLTRGIGSPAGG